MSINLNKPGDSYTFREIDEGKLIIQAYVGKNITKYLKAEKKITVKKRQSLDDIIVSGSPTKPLLTGTDIKNLTLLYHKNTNEELAKMDINVDNLNKAARTYMKDKGIIADSNSQNNYFSEDENGIYTYLEVEEKEKEKYVKQLFVEGTNLIKAYIGGTCEIIDLAYDTSEGDPSLIASTAYPLIYDTSNGYAVQLFVTTKIGLLYSINVDNNKYTYTDLTRQIFEYFPIQKHDNTQDYYVSSFRFNNYKNFIREQEIYSNISIKTASSRNLAMIIKEGTMREIILPETLKEINHFYGASNATGITLPNSLKTIGEYAFYGTQFGGEIKLRSLNDSNLTKIDDYAFCKVNNTRIFLYNLKSDRTEITTYLINKSGLPEDCINQIFDKVIEANFKDPAISLNYTFIPAVRKIGDYAFSEMGSGSSINNIFIGWIPKINGDGNYSLGNFIFSGDYFENIVVPRKTIETYHPQFNPNPGKALLVGPDELYIDLAIKKEEDNQNLTKIKSYSYATDSDFIAGSFNKEIMSELDEKFELDENSKGDFHERFKLYGDDVVFMNNRHKKPFMNCTGSTNWYIIDSFLGNYNTGTVLNEETESNSVVIEENPTTE